MIVIMRLRCGRFAQVIMPGRIEMAAESVDPVPRRTDKLGDFLFLMAGLLAGDVEFARGFVRVENSGVIAAMKIGVRLHIKMFGKKPAAITQSHRKYVSRFAAARSPGLRARLQPR